MEERIARLERAVVVQAKFSGALLEAMLFTLEDEHAFFTAKRFHAAMQLDLEDIEAQIERDALPGDRNDE